MSIERSNMVDSRCYNRRGSKIKSAIDSATLGGFHCRSTGLIVPYFICHNKRLEAGLTWRKKARHE
jgi:hypothetical protein